MNPSRRLCAGSLLAAAAVLAVALPGTAAADPVVVAAADMVCGGDTPAQTDCVYGKTADTAVAQAPDAVLAAGDLQYEKGQLAYFRQFYDPTWGRLKTVTRPALGNHEYLTSKAAGYFDYFNGVRVSDGPAGQRGKGYYSFNLGRWHIVALNSNCSYVSCAKGSAQERWLAADLAANKQPCTLAYWHHPRWSSDIYELNTKAVDPFVRDLYAAGADLVINGHAHDYERFVAQDPDGRVDLERGLTQVVVGTGGRSEVAFTATPNMNSLVRKTGTYGVLRLDLHDGSYDGKFVPIAGQTWSDSFSGTCRNAPAAQPTPDTTAPSTPTTPTAKASSSTQVDLTWPPSTDDVGVAGYRVYRDGTLLGTTTSASYSDASASPGTTYSYTVSAYDAAGNASPQSAPATVTTPVPPSTRTLPFTAVADTYVQQDLSNSNFGLEPTTIYDGSPQRNVFIKFNVSGIGGSTVTKVVLELKAENGSVYGGTIQRVPDSSWSQTTMTWNSQPAADSTILGRLGRTDFGVVYDVEVTGLVTGDGAVTARISSTNSDGGGYYSIEGGTPAKLFVTVSG